MVLIKWKTDYALGIAEVDRQHKGLIDLVNRLDAAMQSGTADKALADILTDLVYYTIYHFQTEENLFNKYDYPESEQHKSEHKNLVEKVTALQKKHDGGEKVLTNELMNFLRNWLEEHLLGTDKEFGLYLKSKGVH